MCVPRDVDARLSGCDLGGIPEVRRERWAGARALWERVERTMAVRKKGGELCRGPETRSLTVSATAERSLKAVTMTRYSLCPTVDVD